MSPDKDDDREDEERDEFASRSIFAAGWFRAVLVLTVLAIVVVISLPYLLNWFEPAPPVRVSKPAEPPKAAPSSTSPAAAPAAPTPALPEAKPTPAAPEKATAPKAASAPPAAPPAAPKAAAEKPVAPAAPAAPRKAAAEKPAAPAKAAEKPAPAKTVEKPAPAKSAEKAAAAPKVAKAEPSSRPAPAAKSGSAPTAAGNYWVQLGAFREQKNADVLAKALRDAGFPVQIAPISRDVSDGAAAGQHELFVTETSVEKVTAALKGRGTAQSAPGGVAVKPAFSLQEAMTVSKQLADDGLKVVIRPAGGGVAAPGTLHAVRAGGYPNRTSALAARDELLAKGHKGFLTEGPAK